MKVPRSKTRSAPAKFRGFTIPDVAIIPPEFWDILPEMAASAELKVTLVALRLSLAFGVQDIPYSLRDFEEATGLDRKGVVRGIRKAVARCTLTRVPFRKSFIYRVNFAGSGKMPPHACMQHAGTQHATTTNMQNPEKTAILQDIIAIGVATRVALAIVDKHDLVKLQRHVAYTRYAAEKQIAKNPPAWFVASVRDGWGPPLGFNQHNERSLEHSPIYKAALAAQNENERKTTE